jgi:hypothetical protein
MALTPYTAATDIIENLGTNPEDRTDLTDETFKAKFDENAANIVAFLNETTFPEIDALITAIKGAGWTSESLKGLADLISTHTADLITDSDGAHGLKVEEGDWTPTLVGSSGTYNHTYTIRYGKYYKVGKKVHVVCQLVLSAKDATMAGGLNINGLPFTPNSNANYVIRNLIVSENVNQDNLVGSILPNNPTIRLNYITVNGALGTPTAAIISNTSALYINATYETN